MAHLHTCARRSHQDHSYALRRCMRSSALSMAQLILELFYPRFELVDQLVQRLHGIIANWCHCGWLYGGNLTKVRTEEGVLVEGEEER